MADPTDVCSNSFSAYQQTALAATKQLMRTFQDLEYSSDTQLDEVLRTCRAAEQVWTSAVEHAEAKREMLSQKLSNARKETAKIKTQLGEEESCSSGDEQADALTCSSTLKGALDQAMQVLLEWQTRKAARVSKFEANQVQESVLRQQLGMPPSTSKHDITKAGLDLMEMERQRLSAEKERRLVCLYTELARLHAVCEEVGEDAKKTSAEIHPSYRNLKGDASSATPDDAQTVDDLLGNIDLSEAGFARLSSKIAEMQALKEKRELQLQQLQDVLYSAWDALGITEGAAERAALAPLFVAPERLHLSIKDRAFAEVCRLEECETAKMKELALIKARQLQAECAATHITVPKLEDMLADSNKRTSDASEAHPGQIFECLARVVRSLAEVHAVAERRQGLVEAISRMEYIKAESDWLREFEMDENRYKGRDASTRLNRSIKAQKLRESIPSSAEVLKEQLEEWTAVEGSPFLYDGIDYAEALTTLQEDYHTEQAEKAANFKARHQAKDAGSRNGTPQKAPHPSSPAKAGSRPQSARHTSVHTPSKMTAGQQGILSRTPSAVFASPHRDIVGGKDQNIQPSPVKTAMSRIPRPASAAGHH